MTIALVILITIVQEMLFGRLLEDYSSLWSPFLLFLDQQAQEPSLPLRMPELTFLNKRKILKIKLRKLINKKLQEKQATCSPSPQQPLLSNFF